MTATVSLGALTDIGRVRRSNQDVVCVLAGCDVPQAIDALVVVADGMGGGPAGEVASALAVEGVVEGLKAGAAGAGSGDGGGSGGDPGPAAAGRERQGP